MKIRQLRLAGFGPYLGEQHVDFDAFADDGIFLITGKTGAGKSTILDAICYALFNGVPRYDGTQQKLRSDHAGPANPTWVELEFTAGGVDYRVRRSPEYDKPKLRGTGLTNAAATAELYRREGDTWQGIAAKPVDVGRQLDQIVGLTKDQFLRVMLLAQNRFHHFLQSTNDDRQAVLRTLFGTDRFRQVEEVLLEERRTLEQALAGTSARVEQRAGQAAELLRVDAPAAATPGWFAESLAALQTRVQDARATAARADTAHTLAAAEYRRLETVRALQLRRAAATAALETLGETQPQIDELRLAVKAAGRARAVWPHITAVRGAEEGLRTADVLERVARVDYVGAAGGAAGDPGDPSDHSDHSEAVTAAGLLVEVDETTRQLGSLADVLADEKTLPELERREHRARDAVAAAESALANATTEAEQVPAALDELTAALAEARLIAGGAPDAVDAAARASAALAAAERVTQLDTQLGEARDAHRTASAAHLAAAAKHHALVEQRLTGHAFELASALVPGEPCAVCGSRAHPAPATSDAPPVTATDVDAARDTLERCTTAMDAAKLTVDDLAVARAEAQAHAGQKPVTELEEQRAAALERVQQAAAARGRAGILEADVARLADTAAALRERLGALATRRDEASSALTEARTVRASVAARAEANRGEFETVSARYDRLSAQLARAQLLATAIEAVTARRHDLDRAHDALVAQLDEHDFADAAAVEQALLAPSAAADAESTLRGHDEARAAAAAILADAELSDLPAEPVDVDDTALRAAQETRDEALAESSTLADRLGSLQTVVAAANAVFAESAALLEQFDAVDELARVVHGDDPNTMRMKLETYVLAAQLEEIVAAANARLRVMSAGRYSLEHDDSVQYRRAQSGLGLSILDEHTGRSRPTHSLSGGETFLASLALALGLAEVVTQQAGGLRLDTLFIDEGFGSLDADTLDIAMSTLDSLRAGGRTIGLISHVGSMGEQIHATLRVAADAQGHSTISQSLD
ncbi:SMC family ATPase [Subtercola sp. RTI3]|uniref:SMC family ATPase n=1 Tax=Subtercola sp. RTI3 TaxID=3048639 RepID=UPI002B23AD5E|nr:SMC family ATPase [Subtercola sp. RTI3]MEA9983795.1 SMC family ATPase [Subtercola sp. RTI3]